MLQDVFWDPPVPKQLVVEWVAGTPFFEKVKGITARASRRWKGEDDEALGHVWLGLSKTFRHGDVIDPRESRLETIIRRKVSNFYRDEKGPARRRDNRPPIDDFDDLPQARFATPPEAFARREDHRRLATALATLTPPRREAVESRFKLGDAPSMGDLARRRGRTLQNVHKLAAKGLQSLRTSLGQGSNRITRPPLNKLK